MNTEVTYFDRRGNYALAKLADRRFPGLPIQGDSLKSLQNTVDELAAPGPSGEVGEVVEVVRDTFQAMVTSYEEMMRAHGLELPYWAGSTDK